MIAQFRAALRGAVISPADSSNAEARKVYDGMIDRKPALIAKCADTADMMAAVRLGRENTMRVSVRVGGTMPAASAFAMKA